MANLRPRAAEAAWRVQTRPLDQRLVYQPPRFFPEPGNWGFCIFMFGVIAAELAVLAWQVFGRHA